MRKRRETWVFVGIVSLIAVGSLYVHSRPEPAVSPSATPSPAAVSVDAPRGATFLEKLLIDDGRETCSHQYYDSNPEYYLSLSTNAPERYFLRGLAYEARAQYHMAETNLLKAIELDPDDERFYFHLAEVQRSLDKPRQAYEAIENALALNQNLYQAYAERSWSGGLLGHQEQSSNDWKRYVRTRPTDRFEYAHLSHQLRLRGDHEDALQVAEQGLASSLDDELLLSRKALALVELKRYREAFETFNRCIEDDEYWVVNLKGLAKSRSELRFDTQKVQKQLQALSKQIIP